ncbi:MAG: TetR/AcrR family transcriptional regulator [Clostridiales bacterium]|nr:TetR/AcrR family transcriptional regulator [Clostridiales bacterium]
MPKQTFFNLKEDKKEKIERALIKEFSRNSFEKASISNIILEANIPRGSFYQYFEDKEDAIYYIIDKYLEKEKNKIYQYLLRNKGDIFETAVNIYEDMAKITEKDENERLFKNILQEVKKNNINIFGECKEMLRSKRTIEKMINKEELKIENDDDLQYFLKILNAIVRAISMEVVLKKITFEEGKQRLIREIEILKKGMKKQ